MSIFIIYLPEFTSSEKWDIELQIIVTDMFSLYTLRRIVSRESSPPIGDVIDAGIVPLLVDAMKYVE